MGIAGTAIVSGLLVILLYPGIAIRFADQTALGPNEQSTGEQIGIVSSSTAHDAPRRTPAPIAGNVLGTISTGVTKSRSNPPITQLISPRADLSATTKLPHEAPPQAPTVPVPDLKHVEIEAHQPLDPQKLASLATAEPPTVETTQVPPIPEHPNIETLRWRKVTFAKAGSIVLLPARLFKRSLASPSNADKIWTTRDGRALLRFRQTSQAEPLDIAKLRRDLLGFRYPRAELSNDTTTDRSLTVAGTLANERFQQHVILSCNKRQSFSWTLIYPQTEKVFFEKISNRMFRDIRKSAKNGC
ncbi:MAG: hypothetical protein AAGB04_15055 [Pseudomonadota bacterium]